jgi:hypothetical protein
MTIHPIAAACWLLALTFSATADTFVMKDGSKLEGTIVREDTTSYVIEVQVTKSIKDERVIAKADVKTIDRGSPGQDDFAAIRKLTPVPDLLTAQEYEPKMRMVEKYLAEHRLTATSKEAQVILDTLKAEANEILAGGIKLKGEIIPLEERRANAYDIDARIQEVKIQQLVKNSRHLQALRAFSEFSKDFPNTSAYNELVPLINQVITTYLAETANSLTTYEARVKERRAGLKRMLTEDRRNTENAIREEDAELEAQFKMEKDAKLGWVTPHPFYRPSLEEALVFGKQELARLAAEKRLPVVNGGKAFHDAMTVIQNKGDEAEVKTAITAAKTALVPPRYMAILETAAPGGTTNR